MTDIDRASAIDDLAFLRGLVDEDQRPGLWGFGAIYVAIGIVLVAHMGISAASARLALPPPAPMLAYAALYAVFAIAMRTIMRRSHVLFGAASVWARRSGVSVKGRAGGMALAGAFVAHIVILIAFAVAAWRLGDGRIMALLAVTLFALQGAAWVVLHAMRRQSWSLAWGWFAASLGAAFLVGSAWLEPFVAAVAVALMVLPGLHMMRMAKGAGQ